MRRQLVLSGHVPEGRRPEDMPWRRKRVRPVVSDAFVCLSESWFPREQAGSESCVEGSERRCTRSSCHQAGTHAQRTVTLGGSFPQSFLFATGFLCASSLSLEDEIPCYGLPGDPTLCPHSLHDKDNDDYCLLSTRHVPGTI